MEQRYPNIFDIKILISAATANATINAITFINGQGMLLNLLIRHKCPVSLIIYDFDGF